MLEAGSGFGFAPKALQVRFGSPRAETDNLERHDAIETLLMSTIDYALAAPADFLEQLIVAKVAEHSCRPRSAATTYSGLLINRVAILAREQTDFQQTGATKFLRRIGENLRPALCTDFGGRRHVAGRTIHRPNKYCRKSSRRLRAQYGN